MLHSSKIRDHIELVINVQLSTRTNKDTHLLETQRLGCNDVALPP